MIDAVGRRMVATFLLLAVATASGSGCRQHPDAEEQPAEATAEPHAGNALGAEAAARAGVRTAIVAGAEGSAEIEAFGRVLDPLPLVEALHARAAAREAATVARAEYERVARLHREDQNASARDLEGARAALAKATADLADATARLSLGWGPLAEQGDALADDLVAARAALLRVDLPAGVRVTPPPAAVAVATGADPALRTSARVLGRAPTTDPLLQGEGYLALLVDDPPRPGAVVPVTVPRATAPVPGVAVPADAVVWVDARPVVYVEPTAGTYERRTVTLGPRLDERWLVTAGLTPGERVVVAGAARLLSSEVLGAEPAAD
jgi:hypothetical protein